MKFTFVNSVVFFIIVVLFMSACYNDASTKQSANSLPANTNQITDTNSDNANSVKDDVGELGKIIKLPLLPDEVTYWEEDLDKPGASQNSESPNKKIVAVLKFSSEQSVQLVGHIEKLKLPIDSEVDTDSRFPVELIAQSQLSGDETLKGKSYGADDFFQTPYTHGKITRIENTDYFVLELTTR